MSTDIRSSLLDPGRLPSGGWITASILDHETVAELVAAGQGVTVPVRGRRLERDEPLAALDHLIDGAASNPAAARRVFIDAVPDDAIVLVSEPTHLDEASVAVLAGAAGRGTPVVVLASPVERSQLTDLRSAILERGRHVDLTTVADDQGEQLIGSMLGAEATDQVVAELLGRSRGRVSVLLPALASLTTAAIELPGSAEVTLGSQVPDAVASHLRPILQSLEPGIRGRLALTAAGLAILAADAAVAEVLDRMALLDDHGELVPLAAEGILRALTVTDRRAAAQDLVEHLADVARPVAAEAFDRLGIRDPQIDRVRLDAAVQIVDTDPEQALQWLEAAEPTGDGAGEDRPDVRGVRLRALMSVGRVAEALELADQVLRDGSNDLDPALVTAAGLAHAARFDDAARTYRSADPDDRSGLRISSLGVAPAALIGHADPPAPAPDVAGSMALAAHHLASGAVGALDTTTGALRDLGSADELAAEGDVSFWPDRPTHLSAHILLAELRLDDAQRALDLTPDEGRGEAPFRARHQLLLGWVFLRAGQWQEAEDRVQSLTDSPLSLRDRFLLAGLQVALALRHDDTKALTEATDRALELVRRHPIDLTSLPAHAEVALASARLGARNRALGLLDQIDTLMAATGPTSAWRAQAAWYRLLVGTLLADPQQTASGRELLGATEPPSPLDHAAEAATAQPPDPAAVEASLTALRDVGLVYEASVLAAAAALAAETEDHGKTLLRIARELRARLPGRGASESTGVGALSERELEVAGLVINGHTYKEIGATLFISAKTVEHHVAHIRTKLGASSRAEMLTALRAELGG